MEFRLPRRVMHLLVPVPLSLIAAATFPLLLGGCSAPERPSARAEPTLTQQSPSPDRPRRDAIYIDRGICPFECCTYREWRALKLLTAFRREGDTTEVTFTLPVGARFTALGGNVHLDPPGVVLVTARMQPYPEQPPFVPGDTVFVLGYLGEGYYNLWHQGRLLQDASFWQSRSENSSAVEQPKGVMVQEDKPRWWVHIRSQNGAYGWLDMSRSKVGGMDACGIN